MACRIQSQLVILLFLFIHIASALDPNAVLVSYSFDDGNVETGPDTFNVFQNAKGSVRLNSAYRFSGYQSVEVRDVSDDRDFPELQGYFNLRKTGKLFAHFAIMTTNPSETLNIALAGPQWFSLQKDGIAFWLKTQKGFLYHISDSMPKKLFQLQAFVWYVVDVTYDIDAGVYDLAVRAEGSELPIYSLKNQTNAGNHPASAVDKFSFIGDQGEDTSNTFYFVDDVLIGTDLAITQLPFVAPGRRKLFVDYWIDYKQKIQERPLCIAATSLSDFGLNEQTVKSALIDSVNRVLAAKPVENLEASPVLNAIHLWKEGCDALIEQDYGNAQKQFKAAVELIPKGRIYKLSSAIVAGSLQEVFALEKKWQDDPRFDLACGMVAARSGDFATAEQVLAKGAVDPASPKAEAYFFMMLLQNRTVEAQQFALKMANDMSAKRENSAKWLEHSGDAAFLMKDHFTALRYYEQSLERYQECKCAPPASNYLKLADVYFLMGDLVKERSYREMIYGSLY